MLNRRLRTAAAAVGTMLVLAAATACAPDTAQQTPSQTQEPQKTQEDVEAYYIFTDDSGREITLSEKPEKVAVLFSSYAELWETAGGSVDMTVGESVERGFADADTPLADSGAGKKIDTEKLVAEEPDLVICSMDIEAQAQAADFLNEQGIAAAQFHVDTFDEYMNMLDICTDITGDKEAYKKYGTDVSERIKALLASEKTAAAKDKRILFIRAGSGVKYTKAKTAKDNFVCAMLDELGTVNIADSAAVPLDTLSFEEILTADPDYIFISTMGDEQEAKNYMDSLIGQEPWASLRAVKSGAYAYLPKDMFQFKPNARWGDAYEYLINLLSAENK